MATETVWKNINDVPLDTLVLVYDSFQGYAILEMNDQGEFFDGQGYYDDSGTDWGLWTELPPKPGNSN